MTRIPAATFRLQLHGGLRFADARRLVPYLHDLGVSDLYLSPIFRARPGSEHGYDVTDPGELDERLGTDQEFHELADELRSRRMGLLLDVVPNHMAASADNSWWRDVLEHGPASVFATTFDLDWTGGGDPSLRDRVLLPILGAPLGELLAKREIRLERRDGRFLVRYHDHELPVDPGSWSPLLVELARLTDEDARRDVCRWIRRIRRIPPREAEHAGRRAEACERMRKTISKRLREDTRLDEGFDRAVEKFNRLPDAATGDDPLRELLAGQAYVLAYWRSAAARINYRRFFDIADLVSIRVEDPEVFERTHRRLVELVRKNDVTGVRIDHVDGLFDPVAYLRRLERTFGGGRGSRRFYVLVEKILSPGETLRDDWPVYGTTGYEFTDAVNGLLVDRKGLLSIDRTYRRFTGLRKDFEDLAYEQKRRVLDELFQADLRRVARELRNVAETDPVGRTLPEDELLAALAEVTACLPVYRTYVRNGGPSEADRTWIDATVRRARSRMSAPAAKALRFVEHVLHQKRPLDRGASRRAALRFVMKWQQLTGPVTAKGVEDTALYRYARLLSLNVVGGSPDPSPAALTTEAFHEFNRYRARHWPHTLNTTSTHDSKRSEDVRARLHVLSDVPTLWSRAVHRWHRENSRHRFRLRKRVFPEPNDEMFLYQTLVGAWPYDEADVPELRGRVESYAVKAAREAKVHTSWLERDDAYEEGLVDFVRRILDPSRSRRFLEDLRRFVERVSFYGALNSLAQVLLKTGSPGVPDFYQGQSLWDLSLVDPDNRRPVDFDRRERVLAELRRASRGDRRVLVEELLESWKDGRIKTYVTLRALSVRRRQPRLFARGRYVPLEIGGTRSRHVVAFARNDGRRWVLFVAPVGLAQLRESPLDPRLWKGTAVRLPSRTPLRWRNAFTGEDVRSDRRRGLLVREVLANFPVAILTPR